MSVRDEQNEIYIFCFKCCVDLMNINFNQNLLDEKEKNIVTEIRTDQNLKRLLPLSFDWNAYTKITSKYLPPEHFILCGAFYNSLTYNFAIWYRLFWELKERNVLCKWNSRWKVSVLYCFNYAIQKRKKDFKAVSVLCACVSCVGIVFLILLFILSSQRMQYPRMANCFIHQHLAWLNCICFFRRKRQKTEWALLPSVYGRVCVQIYMECHSWPNAN